MRTFLTNRLSLAVALALVAGAALVLPASAQEAVEKEPNNERAQATAITLGGVVKGFANEDEDDDWYALTIPAPGLDALILELTGAPDEVNLALYFCDISGKVLSEMDCYSSGEPETLVRLRQAAGKFLINVHADRGGDTEHPYTLKVRKNDRPPATAEEVGTALAKALNFLASTQQADGSWPGHEISGAGLAVMSFIGGECAGRDHSARIRAGLDFLRSQFTPDSQFPAGSEEAAIQGGMFGPVSSKSMYEQAIATLGVIEALVALDDPSLESIAEEAVQLIVRSQNSSQKPATLKGPTPADSPHYGGWRYEPDYTDADLSVSAWQILTLRAAVNAGFSVPNGYSPTPRNMSGRSRAQTARSVTKVPWTSATPVPGRGWGPCPFSSADPPRTPLSRRPYALCRTTARSGTSNTRATAIRSTTGITGPGSCT